MQVRLGAAFIPEDAGVCACVCVLVLDLLLVVVSQAKPPRSTHAALPNPVRERTIYLFPVNTYNSTYKIYIPALQKSAPPKQRCLRLRDIRKGRKIKQSAPKRKKKAIRVLTKSYDLFCFLSADVKSLDSCAMKYILNVQAEKQDKNESRKTLS